ncbi:MAG: phosphotransferase [Patescibacteria group bacterium]|nr:phosphotransferase [Patescibacteria group bacterium]
MDLAVKKQQLSLARSSRIKLLAKYKLRLIKVHRNGPRFYVAHCWLGKRPVIFKMCLFAHSLDPRTNEGLKREAVTLKYFHTHKLGLLGQTTPDVAFYGASGRTWYIREHLVGQCQSVRGSNFVFRPSFFTKSTADWLVDFFINLHRASKVLPQSMKGVYARHTLKTNLRLINWPKVPQIIPLPNATDRIKSWFSKQERLFDSNQNVLTHYEPYASHFFYAKQKHFKIIDWENVDWGSPAHDLSIIWNRAFEHPAWQKYLVNKFSKLTSSRRVFKRLFETETILQGLSNIDYFYRTSQPVEKKLKKKAIAFYQKNILEILKG